MDLMIAHYKFIEAVVTFHYQVINNIFIIIHIKNELINRIVSRNCLFILSLPDINVYPIINI